jgi:hypothetical protein
LALEVAQAPAKFRKFSLQTQAFCLRRQCPVVRDLTGLSLEPIEKLSDESGEGRLVNRERGVAIGEKLDRVKVRFLFVPFCGDKLRPNELCAGDQTATAANERPERPPFDPAGDRLLAEARQLRRFLDRVRPLSHHVTALRRGGPTQGQCRRRPTRSPVESKAYDWYGPPYLRKA